MRKHVVPAGDWARGMLAELPDEPAGGERARSLQLLADERAHLQAVPQQAEAMVGAGREGAVELAAWSVLASVVLALDEFVTRR